MFERFISTLLFVAALGTAADAACFADYKAKKDGPLRLHYGVIQLPDEACGAPSTAVNLVRDRIAADGWTLLNVLSTFGDEGLNERRASAGDFYLRY